MPPSSELPAGFVALGPGIYMSSAPVSEEISMETIESAPNVILIFGWLGGLTRHLEHYSRKYDELYPHATQIIVACGPSYFWNLVQEKREQLLPVVEALENLGCIPSINNPMHVHPRILVHSFSNGGGFNLTVLSHLLSSKYPSISPSDYLISALVLDSSPSIGSFRAFTKAFMFAVGNPVARCIGLPLIYIVRGFCLSLETVFGWETVMTRYFKTLLHPRLLPWMTAQTPRLYIFSKKDELIPWQEVQVHAEAAKRAGMNVRCELYEESAHVSHMRLDPQRYWGSIQDLWKVACRQNQVRAML